MCDCNATTIVLKAADVIARCEDLIAAIESDRAEINRTYLRKHTRKHNELIRRLGILAKIFCMKPMTPSKMHKVLLKKNESVIYSGYPTERYANHFSITKSILRMAKFSKDGNITICRTDYEWIYG